ncbi:MAG: nucleotidyltransferase family protein [Pseudomonadota bacterium]
MRQHPSAILIFAAGLGTRMGALTRQTPKPLLSIGKTTLLDHAIAQADGTGVSRIVVNTHYLADQIAAHLQGRDIVLSHEPELLETGGGLRHARAALGPGPVFTLNADAAWRGPNPLKYLASQWARTEARSLLLGVERSSAHGHIGRGDFLPGPPITRGPGLIYTGAQIVDPGELDSIEDMKFSLNLLWDRHLNAGNLALASYPGEWCDVGRPESLTLAAAMLDDV